MNKTDKEPFLYPHQRKAIGKMFNGCILNGGIGPGKSWTGLFYYFDEMRYFRMVRKTCVLPLLWSSFFVTPVAKKYHYVVTN